MDKEAFLKTPWLYQGQGRSYNMVFQALDYDEKTHEVVAWTHPSHGAEDEPGWTWRGQVKNFFQLFKPLGPPEESAP
jgi:hypothetical protein